MIQSSSCESGMGSIQQGNLCFLTLVFLLLTSSSPATDGQIRLAGSGSTQCSGRVEIFYNNTWGTVCDDDWDSDNNKVVCRELGCDAALSDPETAYFGEGTGEIWLDDVGCSGSEKSLTECQHGGFGTNNCDHSEDVGVICSGVPIRLAGSGSTRCSGRVELYHNNTWGTVCDDYWDIIDAEVACRQFGCGAALNATQSAYFGEGTGEIWLDDVGCSGSERSVAECWHVGFGTHNCNHGEDAGVVCSGGAQIRLAGSGSTLCSGRVEIYHNNTWGTVCDDSWDLNDAEVVCREFGCGAALNATQSAYFGEGTGEIWLDDVGCSGSERSVAECRHVGFGTHDCGHDEDAGVVCSVPSLPLVSSIAGGGLLLLLLVLVVVCLVVRRRRRAKEPGVIAQTQLSVRNSNKYEEEQVDYVNVEPMATMRKETEQVGAVGDEDSDAHDYEEPDIADNYIVAAEVFVNKEEHGDEVETSDDENDYVNVTQHWSTVLH